MSDFLILKFVFMLATFVLGLVLGGLIWRFGKDSDQAAEGVRSEVDFWRSNLEQCRRERDAEKDRVEVLQEEKMKLERRMKALQAQVKPSSDPA